MKYIAKEECYFDTGTEVKLLNEMYSGLFNASGKWSMYLLGVKEPEILNVEALVSIDELEEQNSD